MDESDFDLQEVLSTGNLARLEVLRMDGSVWVSTGQFLTTVREGRQLVRLFETPKDAIATGITVGGVTYQAAEADRRLLHGKHGSSGVVVVKNPPYIVAALYEAGQRPADAVLTVGNLADLLAARCGQPTPPHEGPARPPPS
ncbi:hypothetical protein J7E97_34885 [Streptomyces sp. ISL-66]|uniref:profilin n=1 Tax=Streptomyces sp. ISL-66 TaxID=2819186 RepID=UPI001BEB611D|nr:profilin [Streptomyces sp. ISL-66]MBT2472898.1 hypothetical protein [Streptomyces sp. ISL-66]